MYLVSGLQYQGAGAVMPCKKAAALLCICKVAPIVAVHFQLGGMQEQHRYGHAP